MFFSGQFVLPKRGLRVPNTIVLEGAESIQKMIWQANNVDVPSAGNFYIGLCGEAAAANKAATLLTITDELTSAGGYARQPITRDATGWSVGLVNGQYKAEPATAVNFAAVGANFSGPFTRVFICNVLSGTGGILYGISAKLDPAVQINNGEDEDVKYEFFI